MGKKISSLLNTKQSHNAKLWQLAICYASDMAILTSKEWRSQNLLGLMRTWKRGGGTLKTFALAANLSSSQLSQLLSGYRGIGDDVARKIEAGHGLPTGYLDSFVASHVSSSSAHDLDDVNLPEQSSEPGFSRRTPDATPVTPIWASSSPQHERLSAVISASHRAGTLSPQLASAIADLIAAIQKPMPGPRKGDYENLINDR